MAKEMNKLFLLFFSFLILRIHVQGFDIVFIAAEFEMLSSEYFDAKESFIYIDSDLEPPTLVSNIEIIKMVPERTITQFSALGYSMGEYRIPVGMSYSQPMCEIYQETLMLGPYIAGLGFVGECPPPPGNYANSGLIPDTSKYPPFPRNQYEATFELLVDDEPILIAKIYVEAV